MNKMKAMLYAIALQWKLDMRSKSLLITYYGVPVAFFALVSGIFTTVNPVMKDTLIQSMAVMGVAMGASIGLPSSLAEIYGDDRKKMYAVNGAPFYAGLVAIFLSAFVHLLLMCAIVYIAAPMAFGAALPASLPAFAGGLMIFIAASLSLGCVLGLAVNNQSKLTMISQIIFLPSILLSGIMFPTDLLPTFLQAVGKLFPAFWGYRLTSSFGLESLWPLLLVFFLSAGICVILLKRRRTE